MTSRVTPRLIGGLVLAAVVAFYYATSEQWPNLPYRVDTLWTGLVLEAALFGLVYLALPRRGQVIAPLVVAGGFALASLVLHLFEFEMAAGLTKFAVASLVGFAFARAFEQPAWIVIVALLIPVVDTISVWRGPTNKILTEAPQTFDFASVPFPIPGERRVELSWAAPVGRDPRGYAIYVERNQPVRINSRLYCTVEGDDCGDTISFAVGTTAHEERTFLVQPFYAARGGPEARIAVPPSADGSGEADARPAGPRAVRDLHASSSPLVERLGLTDCFFFALLLACAAKFGFRVRLTWIGMVGGLALTTWLASVSDPLGVGGLPALPLLAIGFLIPNADLAWAALTRGPGRSTKPD